MELNKKRLKRVMPTDSEETIRLKAEFNEALKTARLKAKRKRGEEKLAELLRLEIQELQSQ